MMSMSLIYSESGDYLHSVSTNAAGTYSSAALRAGGFVVKFEPSSYGNSTDYIPQFFDNAAEFDSAGVIEVTTNDIQNIDADLVRGGQIQGVVTGADTALGLDDVFVYIYDDSMGFIDVAFTSSDGSYRSVGLITGTYFVRYSPFSDDAHYISEYYDGAAAGESATAIAVTLGAVTANIDATLLIGGSITGTVTSEATGLPLTSVYVQALDPMHQSVQYDFSESDGDYALQGLPTGDYRVRFQYTFAGNGCNSAGETVVEYYDDVRDFVSAEIIPITPPNSVPNIDAQLTIPSKIYLPMLLDN